MKLFPVILLTLILTGCVKSVASDKHFNRDIAFHSREWGVSAREFLSDSVHRSMLVEVQYMEGFEPDERALSHLRNFMLKHLNKPDGITILKRKIDQAGSSLSTQNIIELERMHRREFTNSSTLTLYILYANSAHQDTTLLGVAYRNTSMAIFGKPVLQNSDSLGKPGRTQLEASVLMHEMGHLMGLSKKNDDSAEKEHRSHCGNRKCLMYYGIEIEDKFSLLRHKANIPVLDARCLAELKQVGGRHYRPPFSKK